MNVERPDLDALLDGDDADALAEALRDDPSLGEALALQQVLDASLRRSFVLPDLEAMHQRVEQAAASTPTLRLAPASALSSRSTWMIVAMAAAIVLTVLLSRWRLDQTRSEPEQPLAVVDPPPLGPPSAASRWSELYRDLPEQGFGVGDTDPRAPGDGPNGESCSVDGSSELALRPGSGLELRSECRGSFSCGQWGLDALRALELSVAPQGPRVLVFVFMGADDPRPVLPAESDLFLHRRSIEPLVLYELSPRPEALALAAFEP
ncbi:MAG: hypothetical protein AB1Z98_04815 [Nannocystaceae bacterium]